MKHFFGEDEPAEGSGSADDLIQLQNEVLDRMYGAAMNPDDLTAVVDRWEALMQPQRLRSDRARTRLLERSGLLHHLDRLDRLLARTMTQSARGPEADCVDRLSRTPAFTVDRNGHLHVVNGPALPATGA